MFKFSVLTELLVEITLWSILEQSGSHFGNQHGSENNAKTIPIHRRLESDFEFPGRDPEFVAAGSVVLIWLV